MLERGHRYDLETWRQITIYSYFADVTVDVKVLFHRHYSNRLLSPLRMKAKLKLRRILEEAFLGLLFHDRDQIFGLDCRQQSIPIYFWLN